jgi:hypothetical protein
VKDISQSRMPFPSLQTAPGTTVIGKETPFMHLLMSNEASSHSHLQPSQFLFPGRSPAQSITTTPPLLTAPWPYPRFSSTTTSKLSCSTCPVQQVQLPSHNALWLSRARTKTSTEKYWTRRAFSLNLDVTKFHRMLTLSFHC